MRLDDAVAAAEKKGNKFGTNVRPSFVDMPHIKTLPDHLIPGNEYVDRRLIIIGDVHGCKQECMFSISFNISLPFQSPFQSPVSIWAYYVYHRFCLTDPINYSAITSQEGQFQGKY